MVRLRVPDVQAAQRPAPRHKDRFLFILNHGVVMNAKTLLMTIGLSLGVLLPHSEAFAAKKIVVKLATYAGPTHPVTKSVEFFKEGLERESNGLFEVHHFPNNQLGSEDVFIDQVRRGTIQAALCGSLIRKDEPRIGLMETPFAIDTWRQARAVYLEGEGGKMLAGDYTKKTNVHILGYYVNGFRVISSNIPVESMGDLHKLKIRVPNIDTFVKIFQGLGCNLVMMPMGEVYNALETKVIDSQENPYPTLKASGWWEVQKAVLESRHLFSLSPFLVNGKFYDSLSPEERALFDKWVQASVKHNWEISEKEDEDAKQFLKDHGLKIVEPSEAFRQEMKNALKGFYDWYFEYLPESRAFMEYCARQPR